VAIHIADLQFGFENGGVLGHGGGLTDFRA
jgi:hypothetical protein